MPHIIVEYSAGLSIEIEPLLRALHDVLGKEPSVNKARIKTRAFPLAHCLVGEESDADEMIHITLRVMPRADDVCEAMTLALKKTAQQHAGAAHPQCKITVEAQKIDAHSYCA